MLFYCGDEIVQRDRCINVDLIVDPGMKFEPGFISGLTSAKIVPNNLHCKLANVGLTNGETKGAKNDASIVPPSAGIEL